MDTTTVLMLKDAIFLAYIIYSNWELRRTNKRWSKFGEATLKCIDKLNNKTIVKAEDTNSLPDFEHTPPPPNKEQMEHYEKVRVKSKLPKYKNPPPVPKKRKWWQVFLSSFDRSIDRP